MGKFTVGFCLVVSTTIVGCAPAPVMNNNYNAYPNHATARIANNLQPTMIPVVNRTYGRANFPAWQPIPAYNNNFNRLSNFPQPQPTYNPRFGQPTLPADVPIRQALLAQANQHLGTPYKFGGQSPTEGFDCSGLTSYIYRTSNGINLPRTAAEQAQATRTISFEQLRPGDLIFFRTSGAGINHVGIYVGNNNFIHAASGGGRVTVDNLDRSYWQQRFAKFGSVLA